MASRKNMANIIKRELRQRILSGDLPSGSRVPSEAQLVAQSGATKSQTRKALRELEEEGLLVRKRGSGSYVAPNVSKIGQLITGEYDTIRIVIPEYGSRYVRLVMEGFMERMLAEGMKVVITYESFANEEEEAAFLNLLGHMDMAGVAMWVSFDTELVRRALIRLIQHGLPFVLMDRCISEVNADVAASDNEAIGYSLCQALLKRGHKQIGFITSSDETAHTLIERYEGYSRALYDANISIDERYIVRFDEKQHNYQTAINAAMAYREHPTAFVCVHDYLAECLERELVRLGWTADYGIELACVADFEPRYGGMFPTVYIRQKGHEIGRNCAGLLLARIKNPARPHQYLLSDPGPLHFEVLIPGKGGENGVEIPIPSLRSWCEQSPEVFESKAQSS